MAKYSIIIPVLNEEKFLPLLLNHLKQFKEDFEIVVSDGGSSDNTLKVAGDFRVKVCKSEKGRGKQLIEGTKNANGEIFIYLYTDTLLPPKAFVLINKFFASNEVKIATFKMEFDHNHFLLKIYSWFTRFDSIFTNFGDQVIVIKRSFYDELDGFSSMKIFDDVDLLRRARQKTKVYKLPSKVKTSARRFLQNGMIKTQLLNIFYMLKYLTGFDNEKIYNKYFGNG